MIKGTQNLRASPSSANLTHTDTIVMESNYRAGASKEQGGLEKVMEGGIAGGTDAEVVESLFGDCFPAGPDRHVNRGGGGSTHIFPCYTTFRSSGGARFASPSPAVASGPTPLPPPSADFHMRFPYDPCEATAQEKLRQNRERKARNERNRRARRPSEKKAAENEKKRVSIAAKRSTPTSFAADQDNELHIAKLQTAVAEKEKDKRRKQEERAREDEAQRAARLEAQRNWDRYDQMQKDSAAFGQEDRDDDETSFPGFRLRLESDDDQPVPLEKMYNKRAWARAARTALGKPNIPDRVQSGTGELKYYGVGARGGWQ